MTTNKKQTPINEESLKFLAAEELMYHPEYTQEDIDRICEEGHREYLRMIEKEPKGMPGLVKWVYSGRIAAIVGGYNDK